MLWRKNALDYFLIKISTLSEDSIKNNDSIVDSLKTVSNLFSPEEMKQNPLLKNKYVVFCLHPDVLRAHRRDEEKLGEIYADLMMYAIHNLDSSLFEDINNCFKRLLPPSNREHLTGSAGLIPEKSQNVVYGGALDTLYTTSKELMRVEVDDSNQALGRQRKALHFFEWCQQQNLLIRSNSSSSNKTVESKDSAQSTNRCT